MENRTEYYKKYNDKASKFYSLKFHKEKDSDIIEQLEKQPSKLAYIKQLIREDIIREQEKKEYRIKPEYIDLWDIHATEETIIEYKTVVELSKQWEKTIPELLEQLEEVEQ